MSDRVTILHLGEGESRQAWRKALADRPWERGTLIKRDGDREVWQANMLGSTVAVKVRPARPRWARLVPTDLARHPIGERYLRRARITTATNHCLARIGNTEVLASEWLDGPTVLSCLAEVGGGLRNGLLVESARMIGVLAIKGILNRDCKPSNLILQNHDGPIIAMIDVGGVRRKRWVNQEQYYIGCARMLDTLVHEPAGVGAPLDPAEIGAIVVSASAAMREHWSWTESRSNTELMVEHHLRLLIEAHGDATPEVNPLDTADTSHQTEPRA
ncbi:MAG: hypothetical protein AAFO89_03045 [Planctomycetota bacterium]